MAESLVKNDESPQAEKQVIAPGLEDTTRWLLVYTEYGYAHVDLDKFQQQLQAMARQNIQMQASIQEYFEAQYQELAKADKEICDKKDKEEMDRIAERDKQRKVVEWKIESAKKQAESKAVENKPEEIKAEEVKGEESKGEEVKSEESKGEEVKVVEEEEEKKAPEEEKDKEEAAQDQSKDKLPPIPQAKKFDESFPMVRFKSEAFSVMIGNRDCVKLNLLRQIQLTQAQKQQMTQIYSQIVHVHFRWGGQGFIQRIKIKSRVKVLVKTLHGLRATHRINLDIMEPLEKIKERLMELEPEEMSQYRTIKLIYPMGKLRTLALDQTPAQQNLPSGARLLLQGVKQFKWDPKYKSQQIQLSDSDQKVSISGQQQHYSVLATIGFNSGRHYWEIHLDMYHSEQDVFAGVCPRQRPEPLTELADVYGWLCTYDKKLHKTEGKQYALERYGEYSAIGDTIGVLLEFNREGAGSLTFYKNGVSFGKCFDGMPPGTYYPCVALSSPGREVSITLNSRVKLPSKR